MLAEQIDIRCFLHAPSPEEIAGNPGETSAEVQARVCLARKRQEHRLGQGRYNADMTFTEIRECPIDPKAAALISGLYARQQLNGREHDQLLRLAQTLADMDGAELIVRKHIKEALRLRCGEHT